MEIFSLKLKFTKNIMIKSLLLFAVLFLYYVLTSNGLGNKPYWLQFRRFIPMSIIAVLTFTFIKEKSSLKYFITFLLTAFSWILVYPITYKLTYNANMPFFSNHFDIVFAVYSFVGLTALVFCLNKFLKPSITVIFISLLQFLMLLPPLVELLYFYSYGTCVSETAVMLLFQTNFAESKEFLLQNLSFIGLTVIAVALIIIFYFLIKTNKAALATIFDYNLNKKVSIFLAVAAISATGYSFGNAFPQTGIMTLFNNVHNYFAAVDKFKEYHVQNYENLYVEKPAVYFSKPSTVIMVIGECASRTFMSAYSPTINDTTPWLKSKINDPNFILFTHGYTSKVNTVKALERALTEKNQYNDKEFNQSITIIDIAKKAGYYTTWLSNQGTIDSSDTPITLVGRTADTAKWTNEDPTTVQYDGSLLEYLKDVDNTRNNFIVLHFMGSHDNYQNRYPVEFAKWGNPEINEPILNYDNSLYYSDYVLSEIYKYAKDNLNLQAMVYFSDHGTVPDWKRHPDKNPFTSLRIPLFVYLSDEYKNLYPDTAKTLIENKDKYFTNDLIYDMMCGILNIKSPNYDETQSIASPKYKFTRETLRTNLGETPLTADDEISLH